MDIGAAIGKPFGNIKNLVVGIILSIIPILNILTIPGYLLRVANRTMNKDNSLPGFENFGELIVNSLKAIVVGIIYGIIALIVAFVLLLIPTVGPVLAFIWYIVYMFISLSAMMTLAKTGSIGAALGIPTVAKKAATGSFIASVIVGAIIGGIILAVVTLIAGLLVGASLIPIILAGGTDPQAIMAALAGLIGAFLIAGIILQIFAYVVVIFFYSLIAEGYPQ